MKSRGWAWTACTGTWWYSGTGRPRVKGEDLPDPAAAVRDAPTRPTLEVAWYGGGRRRVEVVTADTSVKPWDVGATLVRSRTPSCALLATIAVSPETPMLAGPMPPDGNGEPSTATSAPLLDT